MSKISFFVYISICLRLCQSVMHITYTLCSQNCKVTVSIGHCIFYFHHFCVCRALQITDLRQHLADSNATVKRNDKAFEARGEELQSELQTIRSQLMSMQVCAWVRGSVGE